MVPGQFHFVIHKALGLGAAGPVSPAPSAGEAGTRRRAVAAPAAARDGACQRSAARPPGSRLCGSAAGAREPLSAPASPHSPRPFPSARARAHAPRAAETQTEGRADRGASRTPKLCSPLIDPLWVRADAPALGACHPRPRPRPAHWARSCPRPRARPPRPPTGCSRRSSLPGPPGDCGRSGWDPR